MDYKGIPLDPFQEQSVGVIDAGGSLLVAAPTGAGKTLIAEYAIEACLRAERRAVYTAPIKALSNQKFRDFTAQYGDRIGIKTGDVTLNPDAQVLLMTTEIFRNTVFESPDSLADVRYCVFDEIHYLDDIERGTVWEESIIFAPPHIRFVCLSATVPNVDRMAEWIRNVRPESGLEVVQEDRRPVPLEAATYVPGLGVRTLRELERAERAPDFRTQFRRLDRRLNPAQWRAKLIEMLVAKDRLPALWFAFNRRECEDFAGMVGRGLLSSSERDRMLELFDGLLARFGLEPDSTTDHLRRLLAKGVAYHHAGLLPTLKEIVERLFTSGLLKLLFATETFAVGVNMPARTVVFNALSKFDGRRMGYIKTREYHQMAGRAGRRGIDEKGYVYAVVEWPYERTTHLSRVMEGRIEAIRSQFNLSYATLLTLYERLGERITDAAAKSFSNFEHGRPERSDRARESKVRQMRMKLGVLRQLGCIEGEALTTRGSFAKGIQGYELQVTELLFGGLLRQLDEVELAIVFNAVTYEAKRADWHRPNDSPRLKWLRKAAYRCVDPILAAEDERDIEDRTKELDFRLSGAVAAWVKGAAWSDLERHTSSSDGDLVRHFRLTIQLLRNVRFALPAGDPLRDRLRAAVRGMNRDVVDAERQLRLGVEGEIGGDGENGHVEGSGEGR